MGDPAIPARTCATPDCPIEACSEVKRRSFVHRFRTGERLWAEGDDPDRAIVLCRGVAALACGTRCGDERVVDLASRGAMLGLADVLEGSARTTNAEMLSPGQGCVLPGAAVREALRAGGQASMEMAGLSARGIRQLGRRVLEVGSGSVDQRVARLLLRIADDYGLPDARGTLVPMRISRTLLAAAIGCRVETMVRTLNGAPMKDIVIVGREGVLVVDPDRLRALAA